MSDAFEKEFPEESAAEYAKTEGKPEIKPPRFYHISELAALPPPEFLIEKLYVEKTFNLHYGPPKSGKTHMASQVAYDLALGVPHFGLDTKQIGTLILAGEGEQAIGLRARAFAQYHGADLQDMDIAVLAERIDLVAEDQAATVDALPGWQKRPVGDWEF